MDETCVCVNNMYFVPRAWVRRDDWDHMWALAITHNTKRALYTYSQYHTHIARVWLVFGVASGVNMCTKHLRGARLSRFLLCVCVCFGCVYRAATHLVECVCVCVLRSIVYNLEGVEWVYYTFLYICIYAVDKCKQLNRGALSVSVCVCDNDNT